MAANSMPDPGTMTNQQYIDLVDNVGGIGGIGGIIKGVYSSPHKLKSIPPNNSIIGDNNLGYFSDNLGHKADVNIIDRQNRRTTMEDLYPADKTKLTNSIFNDPNVLRTIKNDIDPRLKHKNDFGIIDDLEDFENMSAKELDVAMERIIKSNIDETVDDGTSTLYQSDLFSDMFDNSKPKSLDGGYSYTTSIDANAADMMDTTKPLSEQDKLLTDKVLRATGTGSLSELNKMLGIDSVDPKAGVILHKLNMMPNVNANSMLYKNGIPGIKYVSGGHQNYRSFSPNDMRIDRRIKQGLDSQSNNAKAHLLSSYGNKTNVR